LHVAVHHGHAKVVQALVKHMNNTGAALPDLTDLTKLLPPEVKEKLRLLECAGCGRMRNVGEAKFRACSRCESARYWYKHYTPFTRAIIAYHRLIARAHPPPTDSCVVCCGVAGCVCRSSKGCQATHWRTHKAGCQPRSAAGAGEDGKD
jgi:hypothetical protein